MARSSTHPYAKLAVALLASVSLVGIATPAVAAGGTVYVDAAWALTAPGTDPDGVGPATNFGVDSFATIAAALAVSPTRIELGPGVYVEQVDISSDVEIVGQGIDVTTIQDPATYVSYLNRHAIVLVRSAATATISNLTIGGPKVNAGGPLFVGVFAVESANANLTNVKVTSIRDQPYSGAQTGIGLLIGDAPASANTATATLNNVTVTDYQKGGIIIRAGSTATITDSVFQGRGLTCVNAQNGIQIEGGATITSTQVLDHRYDDQPGVAGCGAGGTTQANQVMSYGIRANNTTGAVSISGSTIARNENNITINSTATPGASLSITGNTITGLNDVSVGRPFADTSAGIFTAWVRPGATISGNTITRTTWGINASGNGGDSITSNTFTLNTAAAQFASNPGAFAANRIVGNTSGVIGTAGGGGPNWWGCNGGPSATGCDSIVGGYSEPEWLVLAMSLAKCTVQVGGAIQANVTLTTTSGGLDYRTHFVPPTNVALTGSGQLAAAPASGVTSHGELAATLTGLATGTGTASATVDDATVMVPGDTACQAVSVTAATAGNDDGLAVTGGGSDTAIPTLFAFLLLLTGAALTLRARRGHATN